MKKISVSTIIKKCVLLCDLKKCQMICEVSEAKRKAQDELDSVKIPEIIKAAAYIYKKAYTFNMMRKSYIRKIKSELKHNEKDLLKKELLEQYGCCVEEIDKIYPF